jgi:RNA polymerase sigma-70 factor, ECF subfamily
MRENPVMKVSMQTDADISGKSQPDLEQLMIACQKADAAAMTTLVELLSPELHRFFAAQMGSWTEADDMLQEAWLRIHRVRHTYRAGEPLLAWVYAIARRVRVDNYRRRRRIRLHEVAADVLPEALTTLSEPDKFPSFEELVAVLPESQREILVMLKVNGLSLEETARATASTIGAVKQKAHRAYERLRTLLQHTPTAEAPGPELNYSECNGE